MFSASSANGLIFFNLTFMTIRSLFTALFTFPAEQQMMIKARPAAAARHACMGLPSNPAACSPSRVCIWGSGLGEHVLHSLLTASYPVTSARQAMPAAVNLHFWGAHVRQSILCCMGCAGRAFSTAVPRTDLHRNLGLPARSVVVGPERAVVRVCTRRCRSARRGCQAGQFFIQCAHHLRPARGAGPVITFLSAAGCVTGVATSGVRVRRSARRGCTG